MRRLDATRLLIAAREIGSILILGVAPVLAIAGVIALTIGGATPFYDFTGGLWEAGRAILHGHDPYRATFLHRLVEIQRAGGSPSLIYSVPVYPAPTIVAIVPLALLPMRVAGLVFAVGSIAAMIGGLRLLGVCDLRCYGAALLSWPTLQAIRLGAFEPLLLLAVGVLWRARRSPWIGGTAAAAAAAAKLFLWPVGIWLMITRRWRTVACAAAIAIAATVVCWAMISFAGMVRYPQILSDVSTLESAGGVSLIAAGAAIGISHAAAQALSLLLAAAVLGFAGLVALRGDHSRALGLSVIAALFASPVVWAHYLTLVYVPIALVAPELSPLWLLPLVLYVSPVELTHGDLWAIAPYLAVEGAVLVALARPPRLAATSVNRPNPQDGGGPTVRLPHGLGSTSFRSKTAALRPTNGPGGPY